MDLCRIDGAKKPEDDLSRARIQALLVHDGLCVATYSVSGPCRVCWQIVWEELTLIASFFKSLSYADVFAAFGIRLFCFGPVVETEDEVFGGVDGDGACAHDEVVAEVENVVHALNDGGFP